MKATLTVCLLAVVLGSCGIKSESSNSIRIPGEFEPQSAIWLGLATVEEGGYDSTTIQMIAALNSTVKLNLIVEHDTLFPEGKTFFAKLGLDTSTIELIYQSPTDIWVRDPGPVFGLTSDNELAIADFKYTNYTNVPPDSISEKAKAHEGIDRDIASRLNIRTVESSVAMEGGAFETNGKGVLIQVESITLRRNPHLSKQEIEEDFRVHFNITDVIWLPSGVAEDRTFGKVHEDIFSYGTGGHTDEMVRFANDSTILIAWVGEDERDAHPINKLNYDVLSRNYEILKNYRTKNGSHFKVIKVPYPNVRTYDHIIERGFIGPITRKKYDLQDGDTITIAYSSSYLNYVISDKVILLPEYWSKSPTDNEVKEKDDRVRAIFEGLYPDRKIIGINPLLLNSQAGGMHCRYQPQPRLQEI